MTLQNFEKARTNMVLSQLQPSGIVSEAVMGAYHHVPREMFVPNALRGVCYLDDDVPLGHGRVLMEPLLHALMVQDACISEADRCLDVGGGTGYSAAVLVQLAESVVALEREEKLLQEANNHWEQLGIASKIMPVIGNHADGYARHAPYQFIFINGAIAKPPMTLLSQLADGGTLYAVMQPEGQATGRVVALTKDATGFVGERVLGEGGTAYVPGLGPENNFTF